MTEKSAATQSALNRRRVTGRWPLERVLFAMAGTVTLISALLAALVSHFVM